MRPLMLIGVVFVAVFAMTAPSFGKGWWWVCWRQVVIGVDRDGGKVYCTRCSVEHRERRGKRPHDNCEVFLSRSSAEEFFNQKCDCP